MAMITHGDIASQISYYKKLAAEDILFLPDGHQNKIDAENFFESEWFYGIADLIDVNPDFFKDRLYQKQKKLRLLRERSNRYV